MRGKYFLVKILWVKILYLFLIVGMFLSCTSSNRETAEGKKIITAITKAAFKKDFQLKYNSAGTYVLVYGHREDIAQSTENNISFMVFEIESGKKIFDESFVNAEIGWKNDYQIELIFIPGNVQADNASVQNGYLFDIRTGARTDLNNNKIINH